MALLSPQKKVRKMTPWYGFLLLAVVVVALSLRVVDFFRPDPEVPTATVPAVSYDDVKNDEPADEVPAEPEVDEVPPVNSIAVGEPHPQAPTPEPEADPVVVTPTPEGLPKEFNLAVPFTSQAPTGNWDALHEDACEEASFLMVTEFYAGRAAGKMDPAYVDPFLFEMVDEQTQLGMGYSISAAEAVEFLEKYDGITAVIVDDPTVDDIKRLVAEGKPVIVPAAGRELGNPFFTGEGPLYHMFVIRGYTETTFITNDPGTRHGENYSYSINVVMDAMADWNNGDPTNGAKRILYIEPK